MEQAMGQADIRSDDELSLGTSSEPGGWKRGEWSTTPDFPRYLFPRIWTNAAPPALVAYVKAFATVGAGPRAHGVVAYRLDKMGKVYVQGNGEFLGTTSTEDEARQVADAFIKHHQSGQDPAAFTHPLLRSI